MLRKTVISSMILISASSVTYAKTVSYVGGGLSTGGYSQSTNDNDLSLNSFDHKHSNVANVTGSVFAGKGKLLGKDEQYYLGGEVGANVNRANATTSYGLSASMIPGVMLTKSTMLYGRAGLASNYLPSKSISFATQLGVGVQTSVSKKWDVRAELINYGLHGDNQAGVGLVYKLD